MNFPLKLAEQMDLSEILASNGVEIIDPNTTFISHGVRIGRGTIIYPNSYLIGDANSSIGENCRIGPNAYLREWFKIGDNVKIGFGAEIVRSAINDGTKIPHFCHLGDAIIGRDCNIAAGVVFCNFDGCNKNTTVVEDDVFIGAGAMLIPSAKRGLRLGQGCFVAAGSIITKNVPAGHLVKMERQIKIYENTKVTKENGRWKIISQNCELLHGEK